MIGNLIGVTSIRNMASVRECEENGIGFIRSARKYPASGSLFKVTIYVLPDSKECEEAF